jgi:hypothetical protein
MLIHTSKYVLLSRAAMDSINSYVPYVGTTYLQKRTPFKNDIKHIDFNLLK